MDSLEKQPIVMLKATVIEWNWRSGGKVNWETLRTIFIMTNLWGHVEQKYICTCMIYLQWMENWVKYCEVVKINVLVVS